MCQLFPFEGSKVSSYELIYIVSPEIKDEELANILNKVNDSVSKIGGSVTEVIQWGRKKLAYPISKFIEGNYVLARVEIEPNAANELNTSLRLFDEILRHLLIKLKN